MLSTCNELSKLIGADGVIILGKSYFLNNRLIFRGFLLGSNGMIILGK